jgi:hypothetical protein
MKVSEMKQHHFISDERLQSEALNKVLKLKDAKATAESAVRLQEVGSRASMGHGHQKLSTAWLWSTHILAVWAHWSYHKRSSAELTRPTRAQETGKSRH